MIWGLLIFAQNALLPACDKEVRNVLAVVLIIVAVVGCGWLSLAIFSSLEIALSSKSDLPVKILDS